MRKALLILTLLFCLVNESSANHIKGGFFSYQYLGPGVSNPANLRYRVTLTVYMICTAETNPNQLNNPISFTIFNAGTNQFVQNASVPITSQYQLNKAFDEPCISDNQAKCYYYIVVYDLPEIELPSTPNGYIISYQRCCRIAGIQNISGNTALIGNTFAISIPGTSVGLNAETNSSPAFLVNDTAVVCGGSYFQYSFLATDPNPGDSLSYQFCNALIGADVANAAPATASNPPYSSVPYNPPYNGSQPMGAGVTINPRTGLISGIAPSASGEYVLCVCVSEYRQGVLIGVTRKELHIEVGDCLPVKATLNPQYITCDGLTMDFSNQPASNPLITSYFWDFGDPASGLNNTSSLSTPTHTFSAPGDYTIKLATNRGQNCPDSTTAIVSVWPGFFPAFTSSGVCRINPVNFTDGTTTNFGFVNSWSWNFGDGTTLADTSHIQNPSWTYADTGSKSVTFIVTNSKGCIDTVTQIISVLDKPVITLAFRDTLICVPDVVQLQASGTGTFSWTPLSNIINPNTGTPTVNPITTTLYQVQLNQQGCVNTDSVRVRVVTSVTLNEMGDTTICQTDPVQLVINSNGLQYQWVPVASVNDPTIQNPIGISGNTTTYTVVATIGSCTVSKDINVIAIPYPVANAGPDDIICYNKSSVLNGSHNGSSFSWSPTSTLINANTLNPVAFPPQTTLYSLTVFANLGCPKAGSDTVLITVLPRIIPYAGNDTLVIVGQPLQLNAEGGTSYQWIPATGLSNPLIKNPIGIYGPEVDSVRYTVLVFNDAGCVDSAFVSVVVFKTNPYVFVPTAFTPNGDGLNDVIRPIAVGVKQIKYFSVYNRWGQLLFKTSTNGHGWDGKIAGVPQGSNVFVWMVSAVDYLDKPIFLKGTVTLIR